ncbi:hypothetical protein [Janthinobacterium sp. CAN_S7]|uniref:hypothetical protein n=1 Tax=Janthinobacterium sp. CAN_S7 TaxID=3071704 RepID=UPI00319E5D4C
MRNICAFPIVLNLTRFLNTAQMATLPSKSRVAFFGCCEEFGNIDGKALDFIIYSANNAVSTVAVMYSLIRMRRRGGGKKLLAFMARVIYFNFESSFYGNRYS